MIWFGLLLLMLAAPFWESKAPTNWTDDELKQVFIDSPWAQTATARGAPPVPVYLATANPMELAERERARRERSKHPPHEDTLAEEYQAWLQDNHATQIVLAVSIANGASFSKEEEIRQLEESVMRVGRKKFKISGHFPPSSSDPYLRLAFPRQVSIDDKTVAFDLYLPGVVMPFREVEFKVKELVVRGKLEM
jgi:hypothetical protein